LKLIKTGVAYRAACRRRRTRMRKAWILLVVLLIPLLFSVGCKKKEQVGGGRHIVIATDATWPPMEMVDENKEIVGFDIDVMKAAAEAAGFTVEFKNTAWDGIFAGLASNKYDAVMSSVTITEERKQNMDFSVPYINAGQVLVVRSDTKGVKVLADMKGKAVGAQIGTTGAFEIEKVEGVTLKTYDELGLAIQDLVNARVDGVVADTPIAADYALQNPDYKGTLKIVGEPFTEELYGVAVRKGNTEVLEAINAGLEKVIGTSTYRKLEDKWLR
jgi:polar amino acid transport system substrate-binding protein